jgi:hypothetical protein
LPKRRQARTVKHKKQSGHLIIKIPITPELVTAIILLIKELIALAHLVKIPQQTAKDGSKARHEDLLKCP